MQVSSTSRHNAVAAIAASLSLLASLFAIPGHSLASTPVARAAEKVSPRVQVPISAVQDEIRRSGNAAVLQTSDPLIQGISTTSDWMIEGANAGDNAGYSVATAGDVNGDGYADVIVGEPYYDDGFTNAGRISVYLGSASGLTTTASWTADGDQADAHFGASVSTTGDVNGDGFADVIIGAPGYSHGETGEGRVYVYYGTASGLNTTFGLWLESGQAGAHFGSALSTAGDVNGDGYADVLIGAPDYDAGAGLAESGRIAVYHGSASGLNTGESFMALGDQAGAHLGWSVATAGDVNADGYADIIAGAPGYSLTGASNAGRVVFYHGSANGVDSTTAVTMDGVAGAHFGLAVAGAGDVNGDGYTDIIAAAPNENDDTGRVSLYEGAATGVITSPVWTVNGPITMTYFGLAVAGAGDVNGDGYADIIIGQACVAQDGDCTLSGTHDLASAAVYLGSAAGVQDNLAWTSELSQTTSAHHIDGAIAVSTAGDVNGDGFSDVIVGTPYLSSGHDLAGQVNEFSGSPYRLNQQARIVVDGDASGAGLGTAVAGAGDVNGDGYADVVVGAPNDDSGVSDAGLARLYEGSAMGLITTTTWAITGVQAAARLGASVAGAGDVNGDGYGDVLIGAPSVNGIGRASLYLGSADGLASTPAWTAQGVMSATQYGAAVAGAGDVNGDGYADFLVGEPGYSDVYTAQGRAALYLGAAAGVVITPAWQVQGNSAGASFGAAVASAGDVNADGYSDLIVGAPGADGGGQVRVYLGSSSGPTGTVMLTGEQPGAQFGASVASVGDVNGDGFADVLVGSPSYVNGQPGEGRLALFLGASTGITSTAAWHYESGLAEAYLGAAVGAAGDVNGDGYADVIVGAPGTGSVYAFYGSAAGLPTTPDWRSVSDQYLSKYGTAVGTAGDVNGDGFTDVIVGALGVDHPLPDEGQATVYYGGGAQGYSLHPHQMQRDGERPIALLGMTSRSDAMQLQLAAHTTWGNDHTRLYWQFAPVGQAFTGTGVITGVSQWVRVLPEAVVLSPTVTGLIHNTAYHWRTRLQYPPNSMGVSASRWLYGSGAGALETDLRTPMVISLSGLQAQAGNPMVIGSATPLTASVISGTEVVYIWSLGDGITTTGATVTHQYSTTGIYTAIVTAQNPLSVVLSSSVAVTITDVPLAGLVVTNTSPVRPGKPVTLSATVLTGTATSFAWAFGDGTLGAGSMVTHTYAVAGLYTATVTATNGADALVARTLITVYRLFYLPVALNHWPYMPGIPVLGTIDNAIGATQYAITWTSVSDAGSYLLQEATNAAFTSPVTAYTGTDTAYAVTGKTVGTTYYYRVASITGTYQSAWSNIVSTRVTQAPNTLTNGGFENGVSPWVERSNMGELISTLAVHSGRYAAYLGGAIDAEDRIYQAVTLSSGAVSPRLTFWRKIATTDTIYYPYDTLSCVVWDTAGNVLGSCGEFSNVDRSVNWVQSTADLSAYKGRVVRIGFTSYNNSLYPSQFFIDDVSLQTGN